MIQVSLRDTEHDSNHRPSDESLGYFQMSLRDKIRPLRFAEVALSFDPRHAEDANMEPDRRGRLRRIEVLVVIVVVGFFLALLLPAVNGPRGTHRPECMENQRLFALAVLHYDAKENRFPGYANRIVKKPNGNWLAGSWVVPLFPYLDRDDLDAVWKEGGPWALHLGFATCPAGSRRRPQSGQAPLDYVVNCGLPGDSDREATAVFHNHNADRPVYVSIPFLAEHDGTAYTLMLSENLQAGFWTDTEEANVGMVWFREPDECSGINQCKDVGPRPQNIRYARPSSLHAGGIIASFCDGHTQFISETIDYTVYQSLMTPDDKGAGLPPARLDLDTLNPAR